MNSSIRRSTSAGLKDIFDVGSLRCSTVCPENFSGAGLNWAQTNSDDEMCQIDDKDDLVVSSLVKFKSALDSNDLTKVKGILPLSSYVKMCTTNLYIDGRVCCFD